MLHASETAQLECRMGRGQVESGGAAAPHWTARRGHRLSHRDRHGTFGPASGWPLHLRPGQLGATLPKGSGGQTEGPAVVQRVLEGRGCCWPRIALARAICVRRHPDQRRRGDGHRRLHSLVPLARGSTLEPEHMAGPRGVSRWSRRIAETGSQNAPRHGGRFQPADRATQCNTTPPSGGPPVHPHPEPVDRHRGPGLPGAANHRPHRA